VTARTRPPPSGTAPGAAADRERPARELENRLPPETPPSSAGSPPGAGAAHPFPVVGDNALRNSSVSSHAFQGPRVAADDTRIPPRGEMPEFIQIPFRIFVKAPSGCGIMSPMEGKSLAELLSSFRANVETVLLGNGSPSTGDRLLHRGRPRAPRGRPGTGKTTLARRPLLGDLGDLPRIQFTSDLLPQYVIGMHILDADRKSFRLSPGPLFANVVLADEINRSNPRAQSALLER